MRSERRLLKHGRRRQLLDDVHVFEASRSCSRAIHSLWSVAEPVACGRSGRDNGNNAGTHEVARDTGGRKGSRG